MSKSRGCLFYKATDQKWYVALNEDEYDYEVGSAVHYDMIIQVKVKFEGVVEIDVPDSVKPENRVKLAEKMALAKVVAEESPDGPEEDACEEYLEETEDTDGKETDWDKSQFMGVSGTWTTKRS